MTAEIGAPFAVVTQVRPLPRACSKTFHGPWVCSVFILCSVLVLLICLGKRALAAEIPAPRKERAGRSVGIWLG